MPCNERLFYVNIPTNALWFIIPLTSAAHMISKLWKMIRIMHSTIMPDLTCDEIIPCKVFNHFASLYACVCVNVVISVCACWTNRQNFDSFKQLICLYCVNVCQRIVRSHSIVSRLSLYKKDEVRRLFPLWEEAHLGRIYCINILVAVFCGLESTAILSKYLQQPVSKFILQMLFLFFGYKSTLR